MEIGFVRTDDKTTALAVLERCLASKELLNARIQNLDGVYSIEVSRPTNDADPDDENC
jgi:hypothetical protein